MNSPYSKVLSLSWFFSIKLHWMTSDSRILHTSICLNLDLNSVHNERPAENELHCKMWKRNRIYPFGDRLTWLWSGSSSIGFATATETSLHSRRILRRANSALIICFLLRFDLIFEFQLNSFCNTLFCSCSQIERSPSCSHHSILASQMMIAVSFNLFSSLLIMSELQNS